MVCGQISLLSLLQLGELMQLLWCIAASYFTLELEAAINKLKQLALRDLVPEICIGYALTKTHSLRQFVHMHAIQQ